MPISLGLLEMVHPQPSGNCSDPAMRSESSRAAGAGVGKVRSETWGHKLAMNQFPAFLQYEQLGFLGAAQGEIQPT